MIGVFDSGVGGLNSLFELRRLRPDADLCYYADEKNAPYGTKTRDELIALVKRDIEVLKGSGSDEILVGCCTASAVCPYLPREYSERVTTIIEPTAREAVRISRGGRIGVLATAYTKNSFAFEEAIYEADKSVRTFGFIASELVSFAERGEWGGRLSSGARAAIGALSSLLRARGVDTLILGCTHFTYFSGAFEQALGIPTVSAAHVGARLVAERASAGEGKTLFIN